METIFSLPLSIIAALQIFLSLLLLAPNALSLPIAQGISRLRKNSAVKSVFGTVVILLVGLFGSSFLEVVRGDSRADLMGTIDSLRAQVSCVLCVLNLMLVLLSPSLAEEKRQLDFKTKNIDAMQRQVKGLQAEYERVTSAPKADEPASGGAESEVGIWKGKVDKLLREKGEQNESLEKALKAKATAEAKVDALMRQVQGFDKEYDRVLDENKQLQRRLVQVDASYAGPKLNKKDD